MRTIMLMAALLPLAGCGGMLTRDAVEPSVYVLTAPQVTTGVTVAADLLVLPPTVAPALATERIATRWPGNRVDYYAAARWSGELGRVVQAALVEAIRGSGRLRTVQTDPARFRASYVLGVEVNNLEADYRHGEPPVARVSMTATVARSQERRPLASWSASSERPATANTLTAVTAALDAAFGEATSAIVARTADTVASDAGESAAGPP